MTQQDAHGTTVVVLGGGRAGAPLAAALARGGTSVVVIDHEVASARERLLRADPGCPVPVAAGTAAARGAAVVIDALPERPGLRLPALQAIGAVAPDAVLVNDVPLLV